MKAPPDRGTRLLERLKNRARVVLATLDTDADRELQVLTVVEAFIVVRRDAQDEIFAALDAAHRRVH